MNISSIIGIAQGLTRVIGQKVLLRDIGDVLGFRVLGEEVVEGLVLAGPNLLRDRQPPFLGVVEFRVDVEDQPPELEDPVLEPLGRSRIWLNSLSWS